MGFRRSSVRIAPPRPLSTHEVRPSGQPEGLSSWRADPHSGPIGPTESPPWRMNPRAAGSERRSSPDALLFSLQPPTAALAGVRPAPGYDRDRRVCLLRPDDGEFAPADGEAVPTLETPEPLTPGPSAQAGSEDRFVKPEPIPRVLIQLRGGALGDGSVRCPTGPADRSGVVQRGCRCRPGTRGGWGSRHSSAAYPQSDDRQGRRASGAGRGWDAHAMGEPHASGGRRPPAPAFPPLRGARTRGPYTCRRDRAEPLARPTRTCCRANAARGRERGHETARHRSGRRGPPSRDNVDPGRSPRPRRSRPRASRPPPA